MERKKDPRQLAYEVYRRWHRDEWFRAEDARNAQSTIADNEQSKGSEANAADRPNQGSNT